MDQPVILVVDDDPGVLSAISRSLHVEGYATLSASEGETALDLAETARPQAIILYLMLPGIDGLATCRKLRALSDVPILMLTARDGLQDRVVGLDSGADDYLVKPFALAELLARLRALLRRARSASDDDVSGRELRFHDLYVDTGARKVFRGDRQVHLRPLEYALLIFFLQHPDRSLSRALIFERVWGFDYLGDSNVIDVTVKTLRQKLEERGEARLVQTVRSAGYALRAD